MMNRLLPWYKMTENGCDIVVLRHLYQNWSRTDSAKDSMVRVKSDNAEFRAARCHANPTKQNIDLRPNQVCEHTSSIRQ